MRALASEAVAARRVGRVAGGADPRIAADRRSRRPRRRPRSALRQLGGGARPRSRRPRESARRPASTGVVSAAALRAMRARSDAGASSLARFDADGALDRAREREALAARRAGGEVRVDDEDVRRVELAVDVRVERAFELATAKDAHAFGLPWSQLERDDVVDPGRAVLADDAGGDRVLAQAILEDLPTAVEARHHGADRRAHRLGDLLVARAPRRRRGRRRGGTPRGARRARATAPRGAPGGAPRPRVAHRAHGGGADPAVGERILGVVRVLDRDALEAAAAVAVDEGVRQDAEEPRLEVRARLELLARLTP